MVNKDYKLIPLFDGENNKFGTPFENYQEMLFLESLDENDREKVENAMKEQNPEAYSDFLIWVEEWKNHDRDFDLWYDKKLEELSNEL